ncbi:MAG: hypothetical protein AAF367_01460 [Pseudomonadota bacterium]
MDEDELRLRGVPGGEYIGRKVKNAFGVEEVAVMPQSSWNYFDWCVEQGWDMEEWTQVVDRARKPELTIGDNMWGALWKLECSRYKQGRSCPPGSPPEGYEDFLEGLETGIYEECL